MILGPDGTPLSESIDEDEGGLEDTAATRPYRRLPDGLTLRALAPNAITSAALCSGLTGIRFATDGQWPMAVFAVILAGLLDGIDGRVARLMKAESRFGAELDSLADNVSFGVAPALILFMWSLTDVPRLGWLAALALAVCCALRLARSTRRSTSRSNRTSRRGSSPGFRLRSAQGSPSCRSTCGSRAAMPCSAIRCWWACGSC